MKSKQSKPALAPNGRSRPKPAGAGQAGSHRHTVPSVRLPKPARRPVGAAPGVEIGDWAKIREGAPGYPEVPVHIICTDFSPDQVESREIKDIHDFVAHHRPPWSKVRWIDVAGSSHTEAVHLLAGKYKLHPLVLEDLMHGTHRPKVEDYPGSEDEPDRLFIIARLVHMEDDNLDDEQVNIVLGRHTVLTFQARRLPVFDSIYRRIRMAGTRIRENDASFLCYSLMDCIVDSYFPALERYSGRIEEAEEELLGSPSRLTLEKAHAIKRGLLLLRRSIWPMREVVAQLQREKHVCLSDMTLTYFRDVYDHCVQIIDLNETYHEVATSLTETYMSVTSNRLNEILKVLTVISTIFIPLTFVAGIYGMNMPIPENEWPYMYPVFWIICVTIAGGMLAWFRRHDWI